MIKRFQLFQIAVAALVLSGLFGCNKSQDRYIDPPWLGGSSIETLEKRTQEGKGSYKIFLKLMDMAGQTFTVDKTLSTLFVPSDSAFNVYFQSIGIDSVESLSKTEAENLFALHYLPNPRSRFQLIYEYVWEELQGPTGEYAGLFFRKPTKSTSALYKETVPEYYPDATLRGQVLTMYTGPKLMPLFSKEYFEDYFGDPNGSDYTYIYPGSKWSKVGLNWGNAAVMESEVRTSNGFLYILDQVVSPQKNIEEYLKEHPEKFGVYYDLLQRFASYSNKRTIDNEIQYSKSYLKVPNIANEEGPTGGPQNKLKDMFSAYIPTNQVMQDYLDRTVLQTYPSIDSVPKVTLEFILQTQLATTLGLISKISQSYFNFYGDPSTITKDQIASAQMCSNGVVYEMKQVMEPMVFLCVPGKLFVDANFSTFLYALDKSGMITLLSDPNSKVTLFAPNNDQMEAYGIRYDPVGEKMMYRGKDGNWTVMKISDLVIFVQDHMYTQDSGILDDFTTERYIQMKSKSYMHIVNGGIQGAENQRSKETAQITKTMVNEKNGILYNLTAPLKTNYGLAKLIVKDPELSKFKDMLVKAGMLQAVYKDPITRDTIPNLKFLPFADYWTALIPTNAAIDSANAHGLIPTETEEIKKFLHYHFVMQKVIFDDGKEGGECKTYRTDKINNITENAPLEIINNVNNLTIKDHSGQVVNVEHANANFLVRQGVIHKINSVLKY